jgi:imidazolonepropionase
MKRTRFTHVHQLLQVETGIKLRHAGAEMKEVGMLSNAWLEILDDEIVALGLMQDMPPVPENTEVMDCTGRVILPGYCDSHTHIIFATTREQEFVDKIQGLTYEEIARKGGGILNSARRLRETSEEDLFHSAYTRAMEMLSLGTTAFEVKSGYGLTVKDEVKMLKVAARLRQAFPGTVKTTFLGAHAVPPEFAGRQEDYVNLVIQEMLPAIAAEGLAEYADVFCDRGFFTPEETDRILAAAARYGMRGKIHGNELAVSGGVQAGIARNALSVDHLEEITDTEIQAFLESDTLPVVLPGTSFFLRIPYAPARKLIDAGLPLVIASDFNPGSSPSGNMNLMMSLACIQQRLLPEEALTAVTLNGAAALEISNREGSITVGKKANFLITKPISHFWNLPYHYGSNLIQDVYILGKKYSV